MSALSIRPKRSSTRYIPQEKDRTLVSVLAAVLVPHLEIAKLIINPMTQRPISHTTLQKVFKDELVNGKHKVKAFAVNVLFQAMARGQWGAAAFYLKCQEGWRTVDRDADLEDEASMMLAGPRAGGPGAGEIIDVTPERIPDDPIRAARIYQQMMSG